MKNGKYTNWKKQAVVKMVVYQDRQLTNVYYSFYKEDVKYKRDPLEVSYAMWGRIQKKIQLTEKTHVIAFVNGEVYPQEVIWRVGERYSLSFLKVSLMGIVDLEISLTPS